MISNKIEQALSKSSWIRKMFEEGERLSAIYGRENVFDFSLGNPVDEPPLSVKNAILQDAQSVVRAKHGYMNNAGYADSRNKIASYINKTKGSSLTEKLIVMTCGAAGGLNVALKTLLDPGDEVIVFSPYFVEYMFYIGNHGGVPVIIPSRREDFQPDAALFESSFTSKTRAVLINSPNNPTGVVYSNEVLKQMAVVIEEKSKLFNRNIYVISDEPYERIVYDGTLVPSVFKVFKNSLIINSFSKSHSLPGERIGYVAVNSKIEGAEQIIGGLTFCNRILGYVNAPATMQRIASQTISDNIDVGLYSQKRDLLYSSLTTLGFKCLKPQGAFYIFPKTPTGDDIDFASRAQKNNILVVPGSGFGCPGYFRIAFCCGLDTIERSLPSFEKLAHEYGM